MGRALMSIKYMTCVWESDRPWAGSVLLVMLALADYANDDGYCWPSIGSVARKCRLSERQAQRIIRDLVDDRSLEIAKHGDGRGNTTFYRIKGDADVTLYSKKGDTDDTVSKLRKAQRVTSAVKRVTPSAQRVTSSALKGDTAMSPEPPIEPSVKQPSVKQPSIRPNQTEPTRAKSGSVGLPEPAATEKEFVIALLTDPEIKMLPENAAECSKSCSAAAAAAHVAAWQRDVAAGRVRGVGALLNRIKTPFDLEPISPAFLASALYRRHYPLTPAQVRARAYSMPALEVEDWIAELPPPTGDADEGRSPYAQP